MSTDMKIEVINADLTTKEGWDGFVKIRKQRAREISEKRDPGFVDTGLLLKKNPITEEPAPNGTHLLMMFFTVFAGSEDEVEEIKENYSMLMRAVACVGDAMACYYRSEIWMSTHTMPRGGSLPHIVQPSKNPNRTEAIMLMTSHREFGDMAYLAPISPQPNKPHKRVIGPWEQHEGMVGRFASFLPPLDAANDPITIAASRLFIELNSKQMIKLFEHNTAPRQPQ